MAALKSLPVHRYSVVILTFSGPLGIQGSTLLFGSRVALLGGVTDVASVIISHEQTQSNRVCCFQTLDAVFPKDLLSDYLCPIFINCIDFKRPADYLLSLRRAPEFEFSSIATKTPKIK